VQQCSREETLRRESSLSPDTLSALYFQDEGYVDNRQLVEGLRIACQRLGVQLVCGCQALAVRVDAGRTSGVETNLGFWPAGNTLIAAGSWSGQIATGLAYALPVKPARGQMIALKTAAPILRHVVYSSQCYLVPRSDGRTLLGSTVEWVGYDKRVTLQAIQQLTSAAIAVVPVLRESTFFDCWAGLRPYSGDGLPVLGPAEREGLYFATGHFRNGLLLAPITARLMSEAIVSGAIPKLLEPFGPGRFGTPSQAAGS
jgi:glycine oxidase